MRKDEDIKKVVVLKKRIRDFIFILIGIACATIGLKAFLLPNQFLDGGAMGVSLLCHILFLKIDYLSVFSFLIKHDLLLPLLIVTINIPFILIGRIQVSGKFAIKTALAIIGLALAVKFIEFPHEITDKVLVSVFGGFFLGAGIGMAIRGGCVIDGTEVLAIYISRRTSLTVGDVIALFNIVLFSIATLLINLETALYSMLTYVAASKTVDFIIHGIEEYLGVTIISEKSDEIKQVITNHLGRAVTVYKGEKGYHKEEDMEIDKKILFCVVTRLEVNKLTTEIQKIDSKAFIIEHSINDTKGGMIKKRPLQ